MKRAAAVWTLTTLTLNFNANGIETVGIAVGYFNCHTDEEYLKLEDFYKCGEMAAQIAWLAAEK